MISQPTGNSVYGCKIVLLVSYYVFVYFLYVYPVLCMLNKCCVCLRRPALVVTRKIFDGEVLTVTCISLFLFAYMYTLSFIALNTVNDQREDATGPH